MCACVCARARACVCLGGKEARCRRKKAIHERIDSQMRAGCVDRRRQRMTHEGLLCTHLELEEGRVLDFILDLSGFKSAIER